LSLTIDDKVIGYPGKVRVAQVGENYRFTSELTCIFFRGEEVLFNCNMYPKILILGSVYGTHSTLSENLKDPVAINEQRIAFYRHLSIEGFPIYGWLYLPTHPAS
jgi:hypothetical protein